MKRVFVVEPDAIVRQELCEIAGACGYEAIGFESMGKAERSINAPDSLLVLMAFGEEGTPEVSIRIRHAFPGITLVAIASLKDEGRVIKASFGGINDFIVKPFVGRDVARMLCRIAGEPADEMTEPSHHGA
jgi:DNA-binding response OmpR family regulator